MSKEYRMADAFKLPTKAYENGFTTDYEGEFKFWDVMDSGGVVISDNQVLADHASVAIDSHDAMQDRIAELEAEVESLATLRVTQERDQLKAQNERLRERIRSAISNEEIAAENLVEKDDRHTKGIGQMLSRSSSELSEILHTSPACLSSIQAKAIEDARKQVTSVIWPEDSAKAYDSALIAYINQLRQQSTMSGEGDE